MRRQKVAMIDDDPTLIKAVQPFLESHGFKVLVAKDGQKGIDLIKKEPPDLIVLDVQMPIMNGYESTAAIRTLGMNIPIIGLTANVYKEDIEKCLESGMNAHLGKPFTENEIFDLLKRWLD